MRAVEGTGERFQQGGIELWTVVHRMAAFLTKLEGITAKIVIGHRERKCRTESRSLS